MSNFPGSPRVLKAAIALVDPGTGILPSPLLITLQYNPDSLGRTLQVRGAQDAGDTSEALRLKGPPIETITLEAEIDATDQLEFPDLAASKSAVESGIFPHLSALERLAYPSSQQLRANDQLADRGMLEIVPAEQPLALFVWSKNRVLPIRLTRLGIVEEAFDTHLNPIRAHVSLALRVLSVDDLGFRHKGGGLFMTYLQQQEKLARSYLYGRLGDAGLETLP